MSAPLMPKATAVWLVENTSLTFDQIAEYCLLHPLEIKALADAEIMPGLTPFDPIANEQLTQEEIDRCQKDPNARIVAIDRRENILNKKVKGSRYIPVAKRRDKPNAIAWILKSHPDLTNAQIARLLGTTNTTINSIKDKSHRHMSTIKPANPVSLGLCSQKQLDDLLGVKINMEEQNIEKE